MVAFTFVLRKEDDSWAAKRVDEDEEELTGEGDEVKALIRDLLSQAQSKASGPLRTSYSPISPSSAVYQVIIGGAVAAGGGGGGGAAPAAAAGGGAAAEEEKKEEKKEEEEEEEDDDMGFSLFD